MSLNGIDISSWQAGIDLSQVSCDFVIVKATQGTTYVNPDCCRAVEQAAACGKKIGVYHYIDGSGAQAEVDYFLANIENWVGKYVLCLDWEAQDNQAWGSESYLSQMLQRIIDTTGIKPIVYVQAARYEEVSAVCAQYDCGLWIAQYANMDSTGYQANPWNEGAYDCVIRQYSSAGSLTGWNGGLDLNKFYGDSVAWDAYAQSSGTTNNVVAFDVEQAARDVVAGTYGDDGERRNQLGSNYDAVQARVNYLYDVADDCKRGEYGNGDERKSKLGADYDAVQAIINSSYESQSVSYRTYTVQAGDTLSAIAENFGVTVDSLVEINNIGNPDLIYVGQVLRLD